MSNADVLPFDFTNLYKTANDYATELMHTTNDMRDATTVENQLLKQNDYKLASDPTKTYIQPKPKDEVPFLDFSPLQNALESLRKSTDSLQMTLKKNDDTSNEKLNVA